jgi:predicted membrane-bound spermidine synthase
MARTAKGGSGSQTDNRLRALPAAGAVFALSGTGLAFEVSLTRIFSLLFQYHYVFLTVSLAVLGLGLGAMFGYLALRRGLLQGTCEEMEGLALILAALYVSVAWLLSTIRSGASVWPAVLIGIIPFLVLGMFNAVAYTRFTRQAAILYGADLLGAAVGLLVSICLLNWGGAFSACLALGILAGLGAASLTLINSRVWSRIASAVILLLTLGLLLWNRSAGFIEFSPLDVRSAPPDKTMVHTLQDPTNKARLVETHWTPFSRVDLVETGDPTEMLVFIDGGAGGSMLRYRADTDSPEWLRTTIGFLPFAAGSTHDTLILGAGAGKDIRMALLADAEQVTAVEINPAVVALGRKYADYNGSVLDLPQVKTVVMDGRSFVERSNAQYDLIYLNLVYSQAAEPQTSALNENWLFTREALHAYWKHIKPEGRIGIVTHNALGGVRLLMTTLSTLEKEGLSVHEALKHVALVVQPDADPTQRTTLVLITKAPWTQADAERLVNSLKSNRLGYLYIPFLAEELLQPLIGGDFTLEEYIAANPEWSIWPTTDDRPFFYDLDPGLPPPLVTLWWFVAPLLIVSVALVLATRTASRPKGRGLFLPYFALLGMAFMLIEVPLIQRFSLLLGNPTLSLLVALGGVLLGSGLGSLFSSRFAIDELPRLVTSVCLAAGIWLALSALLYPWLIGLVLPTSLGVRIVTALNLMAIPGFLVGIPFPSGLRLAGRVDSPAIPAYWGVNAVASVLGSTVAMTLANVAGFGSAQLLGGCLYLTVALLTRLGRQQFSIDRSIVNVIQKGSGS